MSAKEYIESFGDGMGFFNPDLRCQAYIIALGVNDVNSMLNDAYEMGTVEDINKDNYAVKTWMCIRDKKSKKANWYYFKSNGYMAKNTYVGTHYVDKNGKWIPSKDK